MEKVQQLGTKKMHTKPNCWSWKRKNEQWASDINAKLSV